MYKIQSTRKDGGKTQKTNDPRPPARRAAADGSRKKLVSRATLKGFMRVMHGHDGHRVRGGGSVRFFADFPVTWFLDDPLAFSKLFKAISFRIILPKRT